MSYFSFVGELYIGKIFFCYAGILELTKFGINSYSFLTAVTEQTWMRDGWNLALDVSG
jgi:hypothetical protein